MIFENVRTETMNRGDLNAMLAACQLGRDRFLKLVERYGIEPVMSADTTGWITRSECSESRSSRFPTANTRRRRAGSTTMLETAACASESKRRFASTGTKSRST